MTTLLETRLDAQPKTQTRQAVADCDIHPSVSSYSELFPYLEKRWQDHLMTYGAAVRHAWQKGAAYPKGQPLASRRDAWPEGGGLPGSDLDLMRRQHLDPNNVTLGILNPTTFSGQGLLNLDLSRALATAANEWQLESWVRREPRLKASVVISYDDTPAAVAEIERRAGDPHFAQILLLSRTAEPLGQRRYWPIYEAAVAAGLPIGIHAFGYSGHAVTGSGWPSFYLEEMFGHSQSCQSLLTSLVIEGVFERFPTLKIVLIEAGCAWLPSLAWRMDKHWKRLKSETPHLKRAPSEYIKENVWITTQPIEEPMPRSQLAEVIDWMGWNRLVFSSDYPHWDFDDPALAFPFKTSEENRRKLLLENALNVFGIH